MYYVYRFLDSEGNILYVGKTNNLENRMYQHFNNGHLDSNQYTRVDKVEYLQFEQESDQHIAEIYLINKFKPEFNIRDKKDDSLTLTLDVHLNWVKFKISSVKEVKSSNIKFKSGDVVFIHNEYYTPNGKFDYKNYELYNVIEINGELCAISGYSPKSQDNNLCSFGPVQMNILLRHPDVTILDWDNYYKLQQEY